MSWIDTTSTFFACPSCDSLLHLLGGADGGLFRHHLGGADADANRHHQKQR